MILCGIETELFQRAPQETISELKLLDRKLSAFSLIDEFATVG